MTNILASPPTVPLDQKTRLRLRATLFAIVDYLIDILILAAFAYAGAVPISLPLRILALAVCINLFFMTAIASGFSKRFRDPSMTMLQVLAACSINFLGLMLAPQIAYLFVVNLFVPLSYGTLHFNRRTYLSIWVLVSAALGIALFKAEAAGAMTFSPQTERILFWAVISTTLARFLAINARVSKLRSRLQQRNEELKAAMKRLAELASRDELTGLWNRREFMRLLQEESRRAVRNRTNFCVAVIDVDHFKQVNDKLGYLSGDAILQELAQLLDLERRATDSVARYGSEQFTLLLSNVRLSTAAVAAERLRHQIMQHEWNVAGHGLQLTISAGVAEWKPGETLVQLLNRAEAAVAEAKAAGRNCVRTAFNFSPEPSG